MKIKLFFVMLASAFLFLLLSIKAVAQEKIKPDSIILSPKPLPIAEWGLAFGTLEEIEKRAEALFLEIDTALLSDTVYIFRPGVKVEQTTNFSRFGFYYTLVYSYETENGYEVTIKFTQEKKRESCLMIKTFSFFVNKKKENVTEPTISKVSGLQHFIPLYPVCGIAERWESFSSNEEKERLKIKDNELIVEAHDFGGYNMLKALIEAEKRIKTNEVGSY